MNERFCGACGSPIVPGASFCKSCGTAVTQAAPPVAPPAYAPAAPLPVNDTPAVQTVYTPSVQPTPRASTAKATALICCVAALVIAGIMLSISLFVIDPGKESGDGASAVGMGTGDRQESASGNDGQANDSAKPSDYYGDYVGTLTVHCSDPDSPALAFVDPSMSEFILNDVGKPLDAYADFDGVLTVYCPNAAISASNGEMYSARVTELSFGVYTVEDARESQAGDRFVMSETVTFCKDDVITVVLSSTLTTAAGDSVAFDFAFHLTKKSR